MMERTSSSLPPLVLFVLFLSLVLFGIPSVASLSGAEQKPLLNEEKRRRDDWSLEEPLLQFNVQIKQTVYLHSMWPCEDPEEAASMYCNHPTMMEAGVENYCPFIRQQFLSRYEMAWNARLQQSSNELKTNSSANSNDLDLTWRALKCDAWKELKQSVDSRMQLTSHEVHTVLHALTAFEPGQHVNFLVWGAGFDSQLWCKANKRNGGRTVFLEQNFEFGQEIQRILRQSSEGEGEGSCEVIIVDYDTSMTQGLGLLGQDDKLMMKTLPPSILETVWDVILIDGPTGYNMDQPGRMQSIYMSSLLASPHAIVCMDDDERLIESSYGLYYLGRMFANSVKLIGTDMMCFYT